jgi:hypothetical protein
MPKKIITTCIVLAALTALFPFAQKRINAWMMSVPSTDFAHTPIPAAPDYSQEKYWAALPDKKDSADWLPHHSNYKDEQENAAVDVFYVYPTAAFYGDGWVAGFDNWLHIAAVDFGILPQQIPRISDAKSPSVNSTGASITN